MAAGCAVVASDLDAFRSVVRSDGVLVPVGDVGALSEAVSQLLADDVEVERLSQAGRTAVQRFDWGVVLSEYVAAYDQALANG